MLRHLAKYPDAFDPETVKLLCEVLDTAWERVRTNALITDTEAARNALARHVVDLAKLGERNKERLIENALIRFRL